MERSQNKYSKFGEREKTLREFKLMDLSTNHRKYMKYYCKQYTQVEK